MWGRDGWASINHRSPLWRRHTKTHQPFFFSFLFPLPSSSSSSSPLLYECGAVLVDVSKRWDGSTHTALQGLPSVYAWLGKAYTFKVTCVCSPGFRLSRPLTTAHPRQNRLVNGYVYISTTSIPRRLSLAYILYKVQVNPSSWTAATTVVLDH